MDLLGQFQLHYLYEMVSPKPHLQYLQILHSEYQPKPKLKDKTVVSVAMHGLES